MKAEFDDEGVKRIRKLLIREISEIISNDYIFLESLDRKKETHLKDPSLKRFITNKYLKVGDKIILAIFFERDFKKLKELRKFLGGSDSV